MKKRGFTLIEIIICIVLISLIGTVSIVVVNKNDDKTLSKTTKKILEAANVYIETEKDKDGNTYAYGINNGGKGVTIPLKELVNSGYVSEKDSNEVKDLTKLENDDKYFVLLANANDLCETGSILEIASWDVDADGGTLYLCDNVISPNEGSINNKKLSQYILDTYGGEVYISNQNINLTNYHLADDISSSCTASCDVDIDVCGSIYGTYSCFGEYTERIYEVYPQCTSSCYSAPENAKNGYSTNYHGLYKKDNKYYFSGMVENNFVKIGTGEDSFRILYFDNDYITLVYNGTVKLKDIIEGNKYYFGSESYKNFEKDDSAINLGLLNFFKTKIDSEEDIKQQATFYITKESNKIDLPFSVGILTKQDILNAGGYFFNSGDSNQFINSFINFKSVDLSGNAIYDYSLGDIHNTSYLKYYSDHGNISGIREICKKKSSGGSDYCEFNYSIRPVVRLSINKLNWSGNGTYGSPYVITYKG